MIEVNGCHVDGAIPAPDRPEVLSLQGVAIVDHLCTVDEATLKQLVMDEVGGSHTVEMQEIIDILTTVGEYYSKAGGSSANTTRGLASLGVRAALVGTRGLDDSGVLFSSSMKRAGVDISRLQARPGPTGRCCILSCNNQRTMRTCISGSPRMQPEDLQLSDFEGVPFVYLSGYLLYLPGLLERAAELARRAGCRVACDMGSFEVVRSNLPKLRSLIEGGFIDICFTNEDEAVELVGGAAAAGSSPRAGLDYLSQHCDVSVVTLGEKGCLVAQRGSSEIIAEPACSGVRVVDTTGAGDLFSSGFIFGLLRGYNLRRCAQVGCMAGGAVVQTMGAEMGPREFEWLHNRMHGELAGAVVRDSASAVSRELLDAYALIERKGRGVVYYGSARLKQDSPHWDRAVELGREVALLLGCTTWSGGGPGMMEAATLGALSAGRPVAGIRISREAGTTVRTASYLPADSAVFCKFLSSRKVALVDSGVRVREEDRTAFIYLPGGLGTLDELFEVLTLIQLRKLGSRWPVPVILVNYDGFWSSLMEFLKTCDTNGTVGAKELADLIIAQDNAEVLDVLADYYNLPQRQPLSPRKAVRASSWMELQLGKGALE